MNKEQQLINKLSPPLDGRIVALLFSEFASMEKRFVLCDWEPGMLDGGQFCEIAARIVYHVDSGNLNQSKDLDSCLKYVENDNNAHHFPDGKSSRHLCHVIRTVYKFRSQRGAIHIAPNYTANELDSTLVIGLSRWIISEIIRIFSTGAPGEIATTIRKIIRYKIPSVLAMDNRHLVLRTDCTVEQEILLLLYNTGETGMIRKIIGQSVPKDTSSITRALQKLQSSREVFYKQTNRHYVLTPLGAKRVREEMSEKLRVA